MGREGLQFADMPLKKAHVGRVLFDQDECDEMVRSNQQEALSRPDRDYRGAIYRLSAELVTSWPSVTIKIEQLTIGGPEDSRPRRQVSVEYRVLDPRYSFYVG